MAQAVITVAALAFVLAAGSMIWDRLHPAPPPPPQACAESFHPNPNWVICEPEQTVERYGDHGAICRCPKDGGAP